MRRRNSTDDQRSRSPLAPASRIALILAMVVLTCAGATAGWLVARPGRLATLESPQPVLNVPLTQQTFDDARTVSVAMIAAPATQILSATEGILTSTTCAPGGTWASGTAPVTVDGEPLLALATTVPLWRDLRVNDTGADIAALKQALAPLGVATPDGSTLDEDSWSAIVAYLGHSGVATPGDVIRRASFVWLPADSIELASCPTGIGTPASPGTVVAASAPELSQVRVDPLPTDLTPGSRSLSVGDVTVAVDDAGIVSDPAELARFATDAQVRSALSSPQQAGLSARYVLVTPITVYSLPAGAVSGTAADACVLTPTGEVSATVVASSLGQTLVTFPGRDVPTTVTVDPNRPATCR